MRRLIRWRRRVFQRLVRLQGTSHSVAFGMALGVFMGFLMPPGLQLVVGIPIALLLRANVITTTIGTFVTNPFTYIPVYLFTCKVGELFLQLIGLGSGAHLGANLKDLLHDIVRFDVLQALHAMRPILLAWVCGGVIVGIAGAVPAYYATYWLHVEVRKLREFSRARRADRHRALDAAQRSKAELQEAREPDEEAPDEQPPPPPSRSV